MKNNLATRMKLQYENRTKQLLPRRTYTIIRLDGKAFHTYTRNLERPFDQNFIEDLDLVACYLCQNIQGAKFAYVQSDEISILLTDFDRIETEAWFDGNVQKIVSVSAGMASSVLSRLRYDGEDIVTLVPSEIPVFDSRVFTIPEWVEVENYFIWRQQDALRNSVQSVAQSMFSSKQLHKKNTKEMKAMMLNGGLDWDNLDSKLKQGRLILRKINDANRSSWISTPAPILTMDKEILGAQIYADKIN